MSPDNYTRAFLECAEKVRALKAIENEQKDELDEYENKSQGMILECERRLIWEVEQFTQL